MKVGIDIMGGDNAPYTIVKGAILAKAQLPSDIELVLVGDKAAAEEIIKKEGGNISDFTFVHTTEVIVMSDHPAKVFSQKPNSSIAIGFNLLASGQIDGFASAGNTGAMMVGAMFSVKPIEGVLRPCVTAEVPRIDGSCCLLLDVGLNADCKPDVLYQYALLGTLYMKCMHNVLNPRVGLLNLGTEEEKGNILTKATFELMKGTKDFNFVGNIEGNDILGGDCDVIVCDGFTGNVVLKHTEYIHTLIKKRNINDEYFERFNTDNYGGTPVLGVNAPVVKAHGASNEIAAKNMVLLTKEIIETNLITKIKEYYRNDKA